jgi:hypothetical protein
MENRFNKLMEILNNPTKEKYLRILFNDATHLQKIELLVQTEDFLGIKKETTLQSFNRIVLQSNI